MDSNRRALDGTHQGYFGLDSYNNTEELTFRIELGQAKDFRINEPIPGDVDCGLGGIEEQFTVVQLSLMRQGCLLLMEVRAIKGKEYRELTFSTF